MTTAPNTPRTAHAALVTIDSGGAKQAIPFQYNPSTLRRSLEPSTVGAQTGERSLAVRFTGAAVESISVEAHFSAVDGMDAGDHDAVLYGIEPQLAALALLAYPTVASIEADRSAFDRGAIEVVPPLAPRLLFVWGGRRVLPVRLTTFSILEEFFNTDLTPISATVSLSLRVLSYSDVAPSNPAYHEFVVYQRSLEQLAPKAMVTSGLGTITGATDIQ